MCACACVYMCVHTCVCACMRVCAHACVCVCVCVCVGIGMPSYKLMVLNFKILKILAMFEVSAASMYVEITVILC